MTRGAPVTLIVGDGVGGFTTHYARVVADVRGYAFFVAREAGSVAEYHYDHDKEGLFWLRGHADEDQRQALIVAYTLFLHAMLR